VELNDKLSAGERAEILDHVMTGVRRMRARRAQRMRMVAILAAVVLVAAVVMGASFAALQPPDRVAEPVETTNAPTPTSTPTPTQTQSPSPVTREPVAAFGGSCGNVIDATYLSDLMGVPMYEQPQLWAEPSVIVAGGIDCAWWNVDGYMMPQLSVRAYPAPVDPTTQVHVAPECPVTNFCRAAFTTNGAWISVHASGDAVTVEWMQGVVVAISETADAFAAPTGAARGPGWWQLPTCSDLEAAASIESIDGIGRGQEPQGGAVDEVQDAEQRVYARSVAAYTTSCLWWASLLDSGRVQQISAHVVPGGARSFDALVAAEGSSLIDIPGGYDAVVAVDNYRGEAYAPALAVRDGVNLLILRGDTGVPAEKLVPLVAPFLALLNADEQ
jgi:hypothetical protein